MCKIYLICFLLAGPLLVKAQSDGSQTFSPVICEYSLPLNRKGLSVTSFLVKPKIYLDRFENSAKIILEISKEQGTAGNPNPSFKYSYNYNGKQYGNATLGTEVFNNILASDLTYEVLVTYGSKSWGWTRVDGKTNQFGPIDKNAKASDVNVRVRVVGIGSFSGTSAIDQKIQSLLNASNKPANTTQTAQSSSNNTTTAKAGTLPTTAASNTNTTAKNTAGKQNDQKSASKPSNSNTTNQSKAEADAKQQALVNQLNYEAYQAKIRLEQAKEEKRRVNTQVITQAAGLAGELLADLQANRERRLAREKEAGENHQEIINRDKLTYNSFTTDQTNRLHQNKNSYEAMLTALLPKVLQASSLSWEDIVGSADYSKMFGKDLKTVAKKLKIIQPKNQPNQVLKPVDAKTLPKYFTPQNFYYAYTEQPLFYWVKSDFYEHNCAYIFNSNQVLTGVEIDLHTSSNIASKNKSFPSSLQEYLSMKSYLEDLETNTKGAYFLADGNTFITKDKIFILNFNSLTIYDLNFFDPNTQFLLPAQFANGNCNNCITKLGIKFDGVKAKETDLVGKVRVTEVAQNSLAEKAGLLTGDQLVSINGVAINFPFQVQWYFLAYPNEKTVHLVVERANKTVNISITI